MINVGGGVGGADVSTSQALPIGKIVTGFNHETRGQWSREDVEATQNLSKEEKEQWQREQLKERIIEKSVKDILSLFQDKIDIVWFMKGLYFNWYWEGWYHNLVSDKENGIISEADHNSEMDIFSIYTSYKIFDGLFLKVIYLFAILGLLSIVVRKKRNAGIELIIWMLLGRMLIHLLIEVQPRYRYLGMPYIFILSAIGIYDSYCRWMMFIKNKKKVN